MKYILSIIIMAAGLGTLPVPAAITVTPGGGGSSSSSGGGGAVSNAWAQLALDTWYTNSTPYYLQVQTAVDLAASAGANSATVYWYLDDAPPNGTFNHSLRRFLTASADAASAFDGDMLGGMVPPGAAFQYFDATDGAGTAQLNDPAELVYFATNGAVSFATSAGVASNAETATTATNLVSGASLTNVSLRGTVGVETLVATNLYGNGVGLTNLFGLINTNITVVTNTSEDRTMIFVTGADSALVNGRYNRHWYNDTLKQGVWTNTASTNLIYQNEPNLGTGFVIAGRTNPASYMYSEFFVTNEIPVSGIHSYWVNPMIAEGAEFTGYASMYFGTNTVSVVALTALSSISNLLISTSQPTTNILHVAPWGDNALANRTNGFPFADMWHANDVMIAGDLMLVYPGVNRTYGFYMKKGTHIRGFGSATIVDPMNDDNITSATYFQSELIVPTDNCSITDLVISNGCIAIAQGVHIDGSTYATNILVRNVEIYPATSPTWNGDQQTYWNVGVRVTRFGDGIVFDRVKIRSGVLGFSFESPDAEHDNGTITLRDCDVICAPEYAAGGSPKTWTTNDTVSAGEYVGGMLPISFNQKSGSAYRMNLNIEGGSYVSLNGATNVAAYVHAETNDSRNAVIWVAKGYTTNININISGSPQFIHGSTNAPRTFAILNEATNNNVSIRGGFVEKNIASALGQSGTNILNYLGDEVSFPVTFAQLVKSAIYTATAGIPGPGTFTNFTTSQTVGRIAANTTTGTITTTAAGYYQATATLGATWTADYLTVGIFTNAVATHIKTTGLFPATDGVLSVAVSGIIYLPAACAVTLKHTGDDPSGDNIIFSLRKL
jgi:hypothetical protein